MFFCPVHFREIHRWFDLISSRGKIEGRTVFFTVLFLLLIAELSPFTSLYDFLLSAVILFFDFYVSTAASMFAILRAAIRRIISRIFISIYVIAKNYFISIELFVPGRGTFFYDWIYFLLSPQSFFSVFSYIIASNSFLRTFPS